MLVEAGLKLQDETHLSKPATVSFCEFSERSIDEMMVTEAIKRKSSFNVIHLDTMKKVDIFILSNQPLAQLEMQRRQQLIITQNPERLAWFPSLKALFFRS